MPDRWRKERTCLHVLYTMEKGKNVFNGSSPLPKLTVNDMCSSLSLVLLLLYHSEDVQISQEDADLCQEEYSKNVP